MAALKLAKGRERHCDEAQVFDNVENEVNHSLHELKAAVVATVAATCVLSCDENEKAYLEAALTMLGNVMWCL